MFFTGSMIKNRKINNIEDFIKQVHNLYLQRGFKITCINAYIIFEPLGVEMADIGIYVHCAYNKERVPEFD